MKKKMMWFCVTLAIVMAAGSVYARARRSRNLVPAVNIVNPLDGYAGQTI